MGCGLEHDILTSEPLRSNSNGHDRKGLSIPDDLSGGGLSSDVLFPDVLEPLPSPQGDDSPPCMENTNEDCIRSSQASLTEYVFSSAHYRQSKSRNRSGGEAGGLLSTDVRQVLTGIVLGNPMYQGSFPPFLSRYHFQSLDLGGVQVFREGLGKVLLPATLNEIRRDIIRYCYAYGDVIGIPPSPRLASEVVKLVEAVAPNFDEEIAPVRFLSDSGYTYHRLGFDPVPSSTLDKVPNWKALVDRMGDNGKAFCMRIGSLFDPMSDRKQAIYLYDEVGDTGKSQVVEVLRKLFASSFMVLGNEDLKSNFWRVTLVGKRVLVVNEATTRFIKSDAFKSITGDSEHSYQQKGKAICRGSLDVLIFFFSNTPPTLPSLKPLHERIIAINLKPFKGEKMPPAAYQLLLEQELPTFIGYCLEVYEPYRGGYRIPCDQSLLQELSEAGDADAIDFFEHHFVADKGGMVSATVMRQVFERERVSTQRQKRWKDVWCQRYGVVHKRLGMQEDGKRGSFHYHGLRLRDKGAASPP